MSDVVAVMHQGRIAQIGPPRLLYEAPADVFVADFLGDSNLLAGRCLRAAGDAATVELPSGEVIDAVQGTVAAKPGDEVVVLIRPEDIAIEWAPQAAESRNTVTATLRDIAYHGDTFKLEVLARQHRDDGQGCAGARAPPRSRPAALALLENHLRDFSLMASMIRARSGEIDAQRGGRLGRSLSPLLGNRTRVHPSSVITIRRIGYIRLG